MCSKELMSLKKIISIIICAIVAAMIAVAFAKSAERQSSFFEQNVKALTRDIGVYATCGDTKTSDCVFYCSVCGTGFFAKNHKMPIKSVTGRCPSCNHELSLN